MEKKIMTTATIFWIIVGIISLVAIICATIIKLARLGRECKHEWKTVKEIRVTEDGTDDTACVGYRYIQQCTHCGEVRHKDCYN
jgi:hypothetical protein